MIRLTENGDPVEKLLFQNIEKIEDHLKILFEEYKMYVEIMDKTSSRRDSSNQFYLTLNSAIITLSTLMYGFSACPIYIANLWLIIIGIIGILICYSWFQTISSFKKLNEGRFRVINLMEKKLPAQLFSAEWIHLKGDKQEAPKNVEKTESKSEYKELTQTEVNIPKIFGFIYFIIVIIGFILLTGLDIKNILNIN